MARTVCQIVGKVTEQCSYGCDHDVVYASVKRVDATGETPALRQRL